MTLAFSGYSCALSIEGATIAEGRANSGTINQNIVDLTSRDSLRWFEGVSSIRDWEISGDGLYIFNDLARRKLEYHLISRSPLTLTCILTLSDGTRTWNGECICTNLVYANPHDDAATASYTLKGTGALAPSAS